MSGWTLLERSARSGPRGSREGVRIGVGMPPRTASSSRWGLWTAAGEPLPLPSPLSQTRISEPGVCAWSMDAAKAKLLSLGPPALLSRTWAPSCGGGPAVPLGECLGILPIGGERGALVM